ncbi:sensor histidine kinase [Desulforamulus aquiferis]|uniref:histidine kinase n=1 Tax=Desulforamulus aquiferis TaxID=1397668 RepID=A0AAW7ZG64_9FIRM|nr:sensor histidine kinase [Desulforamulus aquiferis]MDO7788272.1 histidine kinase N-terminal domain-containing protein [Desulforamulus aquiferis]RYD03458.1 histidine kinase [Desulforamulus aquiferis]
MGREPREVLFNLCQDQTALEEEDISVLRNLQGNLQHFADLAGADIFIDVLTKEPDIAVVVAEAKPSTAPSLYKSSVVGQQAIRCNEPAVFQTFETGKPVPNMQGTSQEGYPISQTVIPIKNSSNKSIGVLIMERDNSAQVRQEKTMEFLSKTTQKLTDTLLSQTEVGEVLPTLIHDALFIVDSRNKLVYANYVAHELLIELTRELNPVSMSIDQLINKVPELGPIFSRKFDTQEVDVQGNTVLVRTLPIIEGIEVRGTIYLLRDITELRKKEKQLIAKSAVIKEIHHRVKNNLQTIASLMRLQMRRVKNKDVTAAFQESINRISCIALVHDIISRDTTESIELTECLKRIGKILTESMLSPEQDITIEVRGEFLRIPSEQATPTSIVVNEILQNSLKHGFVDKTQGKISVIVETLETTVKLVIRDDGKGFPAGFNRETSANLGLQITQALVSESLGGRINMYNNNGAVVVIEVPRWGAADDETVAYSSSR